jgi:hypothetical protein
MKASTFMDAFIANWVARFGVPTTVTTDREAQFTSALWSGACMSLGIRHVLTTAYHPQSNGMVERIHRHIKDALRKHGEGSTWHSHLPWVLMGPSAAPKEDSAVSSAELLTGFSVILLGQLLHVPDPPLVDMPLPPTRPASYAATTNTPPAHLANMRVGGQQKPMTHPYASPYLVVSKGAKTFTIQVGQRQEVISVDRLKAHIGLSPVSPTEAVSCGSPTKKPAATSIQPASS